MKSYQLVNPRLSTAIVILTFLIAHSLVACDADAANPTAVDSVSAADDESDEAPRETEADGTSPDRDDSNPEAKEIAEENATDEGREEDDEPTGALAELKKEDKGVAEIVNSALDSEHLLDELADVDDSIEDPDASDTRCPPGARCASNVDDTDGTSPTLQFGNPEIDGPMERRELEIGFRRLESQFNACVQTIDAPEKRAGKLILEWTIELRGHREPSARATNPEMKESTFDDEAFHQCLATVIRRAAFPYAGSQKIDVRYPLEFRIGDD